MSCRGKENDNVSFIWPLRIRSDRRLIRTDSFLSYRDFYRLDDAMLFINIGLMRESVLTDVTKSLLKSVPKC